MEDADAAIRRLFADYPANPPRHAGDALTLSEAQRDENLTQFLDQRGERLGIIDGFLVTKGVDRAPMLTVSDRGIAAAQAIDRWLNDTLPRRPFSPISGDETPNPAARAFRASHNKPAGGVRGGITAPVTPLSELTEIVGKEDLPRNEVVKKVWGLHQEERPAGRQGRRADGRGQLLPTSARLVFVRQPAPPKPPSRKC